MPTTEPTKTTVTPSQKKETKSTIDVARTMENEIEVGIGHKSTLNFEATVRNPAAIDTAEATSLTISMRKPLSTNNKTPEETIQEILRTNAPTLNFQSKEAVTDEMKTTRRPTLYVAPWKKSIKSIDKRNPTSSAIKFSSTYISVALTHIMAAIIVLLS